VDIETQRGAETAWTYLAFDSSSPYIDPGAPGPPAPLANPNNAATECATATAMCKSGCFRTRSP
jgi:hypothetical protein